MLHLMKVYRQLEIQDGGPKRGKALTLMVILGVTLYSCYTLHRNINPTIISMLMRSVSRMPLISLPHSLKKRK